MLARLTRGEATVTELAGAARGQSAGDLPASAGARRCRPRRPGPAGAVPPCRLDPAPLRDVGEWIETYRAFFDDRLDRLAEHLETLSPPRNP